MTTDKFIEENKTATLKKGDQVKMHSCHEATIHHSRIWTCITDSFLDKAKQEVVFLECFSGYFMVEYLKKIN